MTTRLVSKASILRLLFPSGFMNGLIGSMVKTIDHDNALIGGLWMIYGHYLVVQPWSRDFTTSENYPSKMVVWIRSTTEAKRGCFARLAVVVDLKKSLISCVGIDGHVQYVKYEGLPVICYECGCYGHTKESCSKQQKNGKYVDSTEPMVVLTIDIVMATIAGAVKDSISLYGPWMQAPTHRRKPNISGKSTMKGKQDQPLVEGVSKSCFQILEDNSDENETVFDKEIEYSQTKNKEVEYSQTKIKANLKRKESRQEILKGSNFEGLVKDSCGGKINGGPIMKANRKEPQSSLEKDQSKEVGVRESKGNRPWFPPSFSPVNVSAITLPKSNYTAVTIEDDNILVGHAHHVSHSISSSSKDPMHAMRRVDTSTHEITKRGFKVRKK
ncbi:hypothetical protein Golob_014020 [Gossypium lobatum]|uniref:CCHC-type domain-containing protein n=1 Tax=Gossypium lobatum TaxID=34289 RepID=A0A7J8LR92_9ROSI|nr:hypothetical protein [Gossypium lobatum]